MARLLVRETYTNESSGYHYGDSGWYEPFTDRKGRLFKALQKEYGRCVSSVYVGEGRKIGWYFERRQPYEDTRELYLRGVWVELRRVRNSELPAYGIR